MSIRAGIKQIANGSLSTLSHVETHFSKEDDLEDRLD